MKELELIRRAAVRWMSCAEEAQAQTKNDQRGLKLQGSRKNDVRSFKVFGCSR